MNVTPLSRGDDSDRKAMIMALVGTAVVLTFCNLHQKYGNIVRIAPNEVSCIDIQSVSQVYKIIGGFEKAQWTGDYTKKFPALSLSMILNSEEAKQRRRLLQGSFTLASLHKNWESTIRNKPALVWAILGATGIWKADVIQCEIPLLASLSQLIPRSLLQNFSRQLKQVRVGGADGVECLKQQGPSSTPSKFKEMVTECEMEGLSWLTKEAVSMEGAGMMVAGMDTTAAVLTYLVWSVLRQPDLQKRLEDEIAPLGDDFDDKRLESCPTLSAIIEETLRLYPAILSSLPRLVPEGGTTLSSHFVPAKTIIYSPAYSLQHKSEIFRNPHQ
ncbi:cytochrome P450 3A17 [Colletotrichum salicis]|uniref:Cytochrome P450 3A17 n=1 Tax=Colletotrichum salicis TaxID=1209931 RepID=A0A135V845_9PEZI|nr:cytochrome P450 3A17 [Colletotrichum salicis]